MNKRQLYTSGVLTLTALLLFSFAGQGFAADCLAIRKKIKQETDLIKRRELISQGLTDCPNDPVINFKYAYSLERFRKYKDALKHYQVATKLDPKYAKAYFGMGDMHLQLDQPHEAIVAYQKGLSIDPDDKRAARSMQEAISKAKTAPAQVMVATKSAPAKTTAPAVRKSASSMMPYQPDIKTIFQSPQNQIPVVATPLGDEALQTMSFNKAGHSDVTGSLDDNLMGPN